MSAPVAARGPASAAAGRGAGSGGMAAASCTGEHVAAVRQPALEVKCSAAPGPTVASDGRFRGYATLFGKADLAGDIIEPGAFKETLARRGVGGVKLLYQHDPREPIGAWISLAEDHYGLAVEGRLSADTARAREVKSLMREGILDGLSIGFRTVRSREDPVRGVRRLLEIDLWEISIVTFPMLPEARLRAAKSAVHPHASEEWRLAAALRRGAQILRHER